MRLTSPFNRVVQLSLALLVAVSFAPAVTAQEGRLVREKVHGKSLEKTVTGESADRSGRRPDILTKSKPAAVFLRFAFSPWQTGNFSRSTGIQ